MISSEEKKMKSREIAFYGSILLGIYYLLFSPEEWSVSFGIMWIFQSFFNAMRYRYRKHAFSFWDEEITEQLTWIAFVLPGLLLGLVFLYPLGIAIGSILASLIWFVFWRLWLEEYIFDFWH